MDIKGIDNLNNNLTVNGSSKKTSLKKRTEPIQPETTEQTEISNTRMKTLANEMKTAQNRISEKQAYLNSLNQASELLLSKKNIAKLYQEMINLRNKPSFNKKPLMEKIIPDNRDLFQRPDQLKQLTNKVSVEITKTRKRIYQEQQQFKKFSISAENIKASVSSKDIQQIKNFINRAHLHKDFNKGNLFTYLS